MQNECQLEILNETAQILHARKEMLARTLALRRAAKNCADDPKTLERLHKNIRAVENQVDTWMKVTLLISIPLIGILEGPGRREWGSYKTQRKPY